MSGCAIISHIHASWYAHRLLRVLDAGDRAPIWGNYDMAPDRPLSRTPRTVGRQCRTQVSDCPCIHFRCRPRAVNRPSRGTRPSRWLRGTCNPMRLRSLRRPEPATLTSATMDRLPWSAHLTLSPPALKLRCAFVFCVHSRFASVCVVIVILFI